MVEIRGGWSSDPMEIDPDWTGAQLRYWDLIAKDYDALYTGAWSQNEDAAVVRRLSTIRLPQPVRILDLACGTGLGYRLSAQAFGATHYHGRDLSPQMLAALRKKHPGVETSRGLMEDLSDLPTESFDLVTIFSTAASYATSTQILIKEVRRVLVPGGWIYMSVLARHALRRIIRARRQPIEVYRTRRQTSTVEGIPAHCFERRKLRHLLSDFDFRPTHIHSQGTLSGIWEASPIWRVSSFIDRTLPWLGHTYEVIARKESHNEAR